MFSGTFFSYNFNSGKWMKGCSDGQDGRLIHGGGISYGPYMKLESGVKCRVRIKGKNLTQAIISVYGEHARRVYLEPEYTRRTDAEILFSFVTPIDLEKVEIAVSNPEKQGDIVVVSEVLDAT
jgi:hypothetical protein